MELHFPLPWLHESMELLIEKPPPSRLPWLHACIWRSICWVSLTAIIGRSFRTPLTESPHHLLLRSYHYRTTDQWWRTQNTIEGG
jgi:hypothetical protein